MALQYCQLHVKLFAMVLMNRVDNQLPSQCRMEQSEITPGHSTVDCIVTLNTVIQCRNEFQTPLWIGFIDLKAVPDSVDCKALCIYKTGVSTARLWMP